MRLRVLALACLLASCSCKGSEPPPDLAPPGGSSARFGPLMLQIGHRLELSGRAARAGRWDYAAYEVEELVEIYEGPLLEAPAPPEIHDRIEPFAADVFPTLEATARAHDLAGFERAYTAVTTGCNACHAAAEVPFIVIPSEIGVEVPMITPVEAAEPEELSL
jgi:hypothetical protein